MSCGEGIRADQQQLFHLHDGLFKPEVACRAVYLGDRHNGVCLERVYFFAGCFACERFVFHLFRRVYFRNCHLIVPQVIVRLQLLKQMFGQS